MAACDSGPVLHLARCLSTSRTNSRRRAPSGEARPSSRSIASKAPSGKHPAISSSKLKTKPLSAMSRPRGRDAHDDVAGRLRREGVAVFGPRLREQPALLEQIAAPVGALGL